MLKDEIIMGEYRYGRVVDDETLEKVFKLRYYVYATECGFEPTNDTGVEWDAWDDMSAHFAAIDKTGNVACTVRLVGDMGYGLPMDHVKGLNLDPTKRYGCGICSEVSRFAVSKKARGSGVTQRVVATLSRYATKCGTQGIIFLTENPIIESYRQMGFNIAVIGDTIFNHGRYRTPCLVRGWDKVPMIKTGGKHAD